jgi:hypothetical protein
MAWIRFAQIPLRACARHFHCGKPGAASIKRETIKSANATERRAAASVAAACVATVDPVAE